VLDLQRVAIGPLALADLPEGQWRHLERREWEALAAAAP
jgi:16S rRNA U516 pseudouridylate synthase RsuA-like enzyme